MGNERINLIVIKTKNDGIFISKETDNSYYRNFNGYLFDGVELEKTYKDGWYKISKLPTKVQKQGSDRNVLRHWQLKKGYPESDLTPAIILPKDWDEDDEIAGLYKPEYDTIKGELEDIEFDIEILSEEENFYVEKPKYKSTASLMTQLTVDPALHTERPCSLSSAEFYKVVREYIKQNIDGKYARITSDYDFCLTVKKVIALDNPAPYKVDVGTKRRPNIITKYNQTKDITVFECAPTTYNGYTVLGAISGKNQKDLEEKVDKYLEDLIKVINKPLKECSCCNGTGCVTE